MSIVEALRAQIRKHETAHAITQAFLPFAVDEIDEHLPDNGMKLGALHEVTGDAPAALFAAGILARIEGPVLWCVKHRDLFAPALAQAGLTMERLFFVETNNEDTLLACFEEGLRHPGMAGVVAEVGKLSMTASRRLQLAAESSGALGIALWRWRKQDNPSAAHTSWRVSALPSVPLPVPGLGRACWRLELMRCKGGEPGGFDVQACNESGRMSLYGDRKETEPARRCG